MLFPLDLRFKLIAIAAQISVRDANGQLVFYVKQKAFKLREAVTVFADEGQTRALYTIAADRVLDLSAQYHIADANGRPLGAVRRRGMRSLWSAHYEIERGGATVFVIREENPWVKVIDGVIGQLPLIGALTGYFLHPAYRVAQREEAPSKLRVVKQPALFEGRYVIEKLETVSDEDERLIVLALLMMLLLERARG
jgi:uncharacterized protein YxjI